MAYTWRRAGPEMKIYLNLQSLREVVECRTLVSPSWSQPKKVLKWKSRKLGFFLMVLGALKMCILAALGVFYGVEKGL
jgi:hypothetical protein